MKNILQRIYFVISIIMIAACIVFQLSVFRVQVPTGSMLNTIQLNQQLLILKDSKVQQYHRGDIVVFKKDNTILIKRLIGLPGETVRIENGTVFINDKLLFEDYLSSNSTNYDGTFDVPEGKYLFLGDNRAESVDARRWSTPYVNEDDILGKAIYYIYPKVIKIESVVYE